jgi:zinc metalloprotease ZmpB
LFRVYRSIGGDSPDAGRRRFASRMALYLILRAVQNLTPATNPKYAREFCAELMATDLLNWTTEGVFGGAYNKVIRWSFEKQGEFQNPLITNGGPGDGTIVGPGNPPDQDVYIDDGRAGEYQYQPIHWHTTTIWNRRNPDGGSTHEEPALGATNHAYVKIKNRGTQDATDVIVRGFHTKPGAGLLWPSDFEPFTTTQIVVGTVAGNNSEEKIVGPFEWTPNTNAYGHDCMLMVVSSDGDASNVDTFTAGEVVQEWRLVPNDNNIGQRNVHPVAGGGGARGLLQSLDGVSLWVGNPNPRRARITLDVELPEVLSAAGWRVSFADIDDGIVLRPNTKREVVLRLEAGDDFTKDAVAAAGICDVHVLVRADGDLLGGMTYRLDPELARPFNDRQ